MRFSSDSKISDASTLDSRPSALRGGGGFGGPNPGPASNNGARGGNGVAGQGGGGGGAGNRLNDSGIGNGGAGTFILRYQIGSEETGTAKATGGSISFYGDKTIHAFTGSGTFTATEALTVEYVIVAGGGAGGTGLGGGGGAGGYRTGTTPVSATSYPVIVGGGG